MRQVFAHLQQEIIQVADPPGARGMACRIGAHELVPVRKHQRGHCVSGKASFLAPCVTGEQMIELDHEEICL